MEQKSKGEIRRSQLITTYGIGAIVAVEDESYMVAGIDRWEQATPNLHEPRLVKRRRHNKCRIIRQASQKQGRTAHRLPHLEARRIVRLNDLELLLLRQPRQIEQPVHEEAIAEELAAWSS